MDSSSSSNFGERLVNLGLPQAYRSILTSLSSCPPSVLKNRREVYLHAASVIHEIYTQNKSAQLIQKVNRGKSARASVAGKKALKLEEMRKNDAALKVQAIQRGRTGRVRVEGERKKRNDFAAIRLQAAQRRKVAKTKVNEMRKERDSATKLQAIQRGRMARVESIRRKSVAKDAAFQEAISGEKGNKAATMVQKIHRKNSAVKITQKMKEEAAEQQSAAAKLQAAERGRCARNNIRKQKIEYKSATILQARKRGADGRVVARQAQRARSMEPVGDGKIHIGDVVKAKIAGEPLWCEGIVIGRSGEGEIEEFDIDFGDGEVQEHVPMSSIRKIFHWYILEIGDQVKAPVPEFPSMKGDAEVIAYEGEFGGEMLYTIKFDDDEVVEHVKGSDMIKATSSRTKAVMLWKKRFSNN